MKLAESSQQSPAVLVIAATDSSGGAGLTRDVRVLTDFAIDALCVVTAVTAQSDRRVAAVHDVPPEIIRAQIAAAFATRAINAIKVGMLGTAATVEAVIEGLSAARVESETRLVIDPVLVSTSGGLLLDDAGRAALLKGLFPLAALVTPNVPEAAALLGEATATDEANLISEAPLIDEATLMDEATLIDEATLTDQGRRLLRFGAGAILLKGGHATGENAVDLLIRAGDYTVDRISSPRVSGSSRGTGCALA